MGIVSVLASMVHQQIVPQMGIRRGSSEVWRADLHIIMTELRPSWP